MGDMLDRYGVLYNSELRRGAMGAWGALEVRRGTDYWKPHHSRMIPSLCGVSEYQHLIFYLF